jgi:hypothetical protein
MHLVQASAARVIIYCGKMKYMAEKLTDSTEKKKGSGEPLPQIVASAGTIRS